MSKTMKRFALVAVFLGGLFAGTMFREGPREAFAQFVNSVINVGPGNDKTFRVGLTRAADGLGYFLGVVLYGRDGAGNLDPVLNDSTSGLLVKVSNSLTIGSLPTPTNTTTPGIVQAQQYLTWVMNVGNTPNVIPATPTLTLTPSAGQVYVAGLWVSPTLTQTPFAGTRKTAETAAVTNEAWIDTWACGGNSYGYTISGTFAANGVAYALYGFNGPTAPSAGAANGILVTGPVTISAGAYVAVDPKYRFAALRLQDYSGATTVTVNDFCNNFNNRQ